MTEKAFAGQSDNLAEAMMDLSDVNACVASLDELLG